MAIQKNLRSHIEGVCPLVSQVKRRKTSVGRGSLIGAAIGGAIFFFLASLVSVQILPLPGLVSSSGNTSHGLILVVGILLGVVLGAACGALVGIGTPMPLNSKPIF